MAHNGKRAQVNVDFLTYWGARDYPFINFLKTSDIWGYSDNSGRVPPDTLNADGYPISIAKAIKRTIYIPNQTRRPGNWVVRWMGDTGAGQVGFSATSFTLVSGSQSGVNGRFVFTPTGSDVSGAEGALQLLLEITNINVSSPITHIELFHIDDESLVDAGEVFSPLFKSYCSKFGVIRFLNWSPTNSQPATQLSHITPDTCISYGCNWTPAGQYKGVTTNTGNAYSLAASGFVLEDKATVTLRWNASATNTTPTLNVEGTGAITVAHSTGDEFAFATEPDANRFATLVYDEELNLWLQFGGSDANGHSSGQSLSCPLNLMLRLCEEVGAHPWLHVPYLALDPPTPFATDLATYVKAWCETNATWMIPRYEAANEVWNFVLGFEATRYAWNKAQFRSGWGGTTTDAHHWYGMAISRMGEAIFNVYNPTGPKATWPYQMLCAVGTHFSAPATQDPRLAGKWVSVDGGDPASDYCTHVAVANYFGSGSTVTVELALAHDYENGDDTAPATFVAGIEENDTFGIPYVQPVLAAWKTWATSAGLGLNYYEGGYSPDNQTANTVANITAASKAAQCVLTVDVGSDFPPVGSDVSIASVGGMTELNGNTYEVVTVNQGSRLVTINVNSTGFTTYTSGGRATYVDSRDLRNELRHASKYVPALYDYTRRVNSFCEVLGEYPSCFVLCGSETWGKIEPDIYAEPTPEWDAYVDFTEGATPLRFAVRLSA